GSSHPDSIPADTIRPNDSSRNQAAATSVGESDAAHVTHDRYVSTTPMAGGQKTYSGRLLCRLTTETEMVIGGMQRQVSANEPTEITPFEFPVSGDESGKPAIPATSLKGLISSLAEAASNSAARILHNTWLSRRALIGSEALPAIGIIVRRLLPSGPDDGDKPPVETLRVVPLTVPPLQHDHRNAGWFPIPAEYTPAKFKVYVNEYQEGGVRRNILTQPPVSHSADHVGEIWYLRLPDGQVFDYNADLNAIGIMPDTHLLHVKTNQQGQPQFILGRHPVPNEVPIARSDWAALPEAERKTYTAGILRVLGKVGRDDIPGGKKHEIFIPLPDAINNADDHAAALVDFVEGGDLKGTFDAEFAIRCFTELAADRSEHADGYPYELKGQLRTGKDNTIVPRAGDLVCFKLGGAGADSVKELSISAVWRRESSKVHQYFSAVDDELLPFNDQRQQLTLAEQMFGVVETLQTGSGRAAAALAGRIRFSAGTLQSGCDAPYLMENGPDGPRRRQVLLRELSSPKPPCPSLYFRPKTGKGAHIGKQLVHPEQHVPQGRKVYLHGSLKRNEPWRSEDEDPGSLKRKNRTPLVGRGVSFWFHIDFDNLSETELGLLCYALRPTDPFRHKLGLGKPIGLGTVRIDPQGLFLVDRQQRYLTDDLFSDRRYHTVSASTENWWSDNAAEDLPQFLYERERNAAAMAAAGQSGDASEAISTSSLRDRYREIANQTLKKVITAIERVGDPQNSANLPVHYPQLDTNSLPQGGNVELALERELYRWFVENENQHRNSNQREFLKPLDEGSVDTPLPHLTRLSVTHRPPR
ncbi:MAG: TIGR03986 family CRISPR-associated RAMP protein, partial [Planctomycetota bacterium]|nr:TIGR03986 family CRISPR-associated RAMP protein [Planctomycetota bacterium]